MNNKKIVFFGTPEFASCILRGLLENKYNVVAVVTQPDKPVGRKKILTPSPVKQVALEYNIAIYQPISLRKDYEFLKQLDFDMLITAAYGQILPQEVLDMAKINNINVHGSLLPKYRGGAPIQRSIMNGDSKTGITIMEMVDRMDAGKIYGTAEVEIDKNINSTELFAKLQEVGKDLLLKLLPDLLENKITGVSQNEAEVTFAYNIKREEEKIDFNQDVNVVHNQIRALSLNPGAYCYLNEKEFKIYRSLVYSTNESDKSIPGTMKIEAKNHLLVRCANGYLELLEVKLEGKNQMDVKSFLNGIDKEKLLETTLK